MDKTLCVAKHLYQMYADRFGEPMDQLKMHKLMYFANRESLMYSKSPLFNEAFHGWKYGPVLLSVRKAYNPKNNQTKEPFADVEGTVSEQTNQYLQDVLDRYGSLSSWKLSALSHDELSWKMARLGLSPDENGDVELSPNLLRVDAKRELERRA